jgi:hypothetical protein
LLKYIAQDPELEPTAAYSVDEAKQTFFNLDPAVVMFSSGIEESAENELKAWFKTQKPSVEIIMHYGGGTGLLFNEIQETKDKETEQK